MGVYLLLPVLPMYMLDTFGSSETAIGLILASYTIAALAARPFSGFLLDMFQRKPIYLLAYAVTVLFFVGYPLVQCVLLFALLRVLHGLAFGVVSTAGNTVIIDIMPSSRRGEGLGYFGIANNLAMAVGPMIGLMLHEQTHSWNLIFYSAVGSGVLGLFFASRIKTSFRPACVREPLSLDRFFLMKGTRAGLCLLLLAIPYGITTSYMPLYAKEAGIVGNMGLFFSMMALGMMISRTVAGKSVDQGKITQVIQIGGIIGLAAFCAFALLGFFHLSLNNDLERLGFFVVALMIGVGYGMMFPAYNTLFVDLAPHNRRATASSTYLTSWDLGIGLGLFLGGYLGEISSYAMAFLIGAVMVFVSAGLFSVVTIPHFKRNKYR